jgi:flagellar M-ring protein FliF
LTKKAEGMLEKVLGPGQAVVRVAVDLNWDTMTRTEEKYDPDGQVARSSTINDDTTDTDTTSPGGGTPGISANTAPAGGTNASVAAAAPAPVSSSRMRKKVTTSTYEINKTTSNMVQGAGGIKRISSAVFVAERFDGTGKDRKAVPRTPEELNNLKNIVKSALGIEDSDPTRKDELTLEEMPFNDQQAEDLTAQFDKQEKRDFWIDLGMKLIYPALAIGVLFLFFRMLKNTKPEEIPLGVPVGTGNGAGTFVKPTMVSVDVLNQLIRENPANMTQAVRSWMSRSKPNN